MITAQRNDIIGITSRMIFFLADERQQTTARAHNKQNVNLRLVWTLI